MKKLFAGVLFVIKTLLGLAIAAICLAVSVYALFSFAQTGSSSTSGVAANTSQYVVMDRYDRFITNVFSDALDGVLSIKKTYWLSDTDTVAPEPNQDCYGLTRDPAELQKLLDDAAELLEGQDTLFKPDVELFSDSQVYYYLDPTILVITWKQVFNNCVYTISEVKIADQSQFRRFLSDDQFGSGSQYLTTQMSASVNAVVASNGDYYAARRNGIVVYKGQIYRDRGTPLDTCFIDRNGDLQFVRSGELADSEAVKNYVEEHGVRFSICFGPVLVENGELCVVNEGYPEGHVADPKPRAGLCQMDSLHYLLVTATAEPPTRYVHRTQTFAEILHSFGCEKAYCLDGGRSGTSVMNDTLINHVEERYVSDMIYFATALPNGD